MKAFLLAVGEGIRLRPLTNRIPKCLVSIKEEPLLDHWLKLCERYTISEVLINLHHLPHLVEEFLDNASYRLEIKTLYEKKLLGSAGTLAANRDFVAGEKAFSKQIDRRSAGLSNWMETGWWLILSKSLTLPKVVWLTSA